MGVFDQCLIPLAQIVRGEEEGWLKLTRFGCELQEQGYHFDFGYTNIHGQESVLIIDKKHF